MDFRGKRTIHYEVFDNPAASEDEHASMLVLVYAVDDRSSFTALDSLQPWHPSSLQRLPCAATRFKLLGLRR